jgi:hypothetical protein
MIDISFQWTRFHAYEIAKSGERKMLRPTGRKSEEFFPLKIETEKPLYLRFSELDGSEEACLEFARRWGLLKSTKASQAEFIDDWRREIREMQMAIAFVADGEKPKKPESADAWKVTDLDVLLVPQASADNGKRFALLLQPRNLFEAMRLQLAQSVSGGGTIRRCKQCGSWFETGASESRRSIAVFCWEKCKNRFHYLERSKR